MVAKLGLPWADTTAASTAADTSGDVGSDTSITIGADGLPIISHRDFTNGDLRVTKQHRTAWTENTWES